MGFALTEGLESRGLRFSEVYSFPKPPKVGKIMAQNLLKAIILHTCGVQVRLIS